MMGKRKRDSIPDAVIQRIDLFEIDSLDFLRVGKFGDKTDQILFLNMGNIFNDCLPRNMQLRLDIEEIGVYGKSSRKKSLAFS